LRTVYPGSHSIRIVYFPGSGDVIEETTLAKFDRQYLDRLPAAIFVPALAASYSFEAFQNIIARLRAPGGCPWDQKQTHQSMRSDLLEETYEVLAALDANNPLAMREEFGDLLLHIVMQAQIGMENGEFSMADVIHGIHTKIVRRHPHVFGELEVEGDQNILANWERMKAQERLENGQIDAGLLEGLNLALPALVQAQQFQARAARVRFDWPDITGVLAKVFEEIEEVQQAEGQPQQHAEIGDLLFAVVNLARWYKVDAESALRQANQRFRQRFMYIEQAARSQNKQVSDFSPDEMDQLWEAAKREKNEY
jgi:tetrapyrrole methylase family protein/MazG family protein